MITSFYLFAALLALVAVFFIVFPFIRKEPSTLTNPDANALRIADYEQRMEELNVEVETGKLTTEAHFNAVIELKKSLMAELSPQQNFSHSGNRLVIATTASLFTVTFCALFYYMTGSFQLLSQWQQAKDNLPELGQRAVMPQGNPLNQNEMQELALGLRSKLAEQGDDEMAWLLLGRIMLMLNDFESANLAFDKVLGMNAESINALVSKAQVLMLEGSESSVSRAARVVSKVLKVEPNNRDAIAMLALIAYERGDWQQSLAAFELIIASADKGTPDYAMLAARIEELKAKVANINNSKQIEAGQTLSVDVNITVTESLQAQIPNNATLFVFAKAEVGPPMPLAVVKKQQWKLPLTVTLSEQDAMLPEMTFKQFNQIQVIARISLDDNVEIQKGEMEGRSTGFNVEQTSSMNLVIDTLL